MERVKILAFLLFWAFLALLPKMEGQTWPKLPLPPIRPLCTSQFALANYACATLPYVPEPPPPSPLLPPSPDDLDRGGRHNHQHTPPLPPSPDDPDRGGRHNHQHRHRHNHNHRHRHRHRSRHHEKETIEQENCCRWLRQVDDECVCDMLVHLPTFLARPLHDFTVIVDETCNVTYPCGGRLIRA